MPSKKYDVAVAYRIYPKVAKPALGLPFSDDKFRLAEICLRSFRRCLGDLRVKIWVLLDGCPREYEDLFRRYFRPEDLVLVPLPGIGNQKTFLRQLQILTEQEDAELVYFAEDDYAYQPGAFHLMTDFMQNCKGVDFVTPHDHPDYYDLELHSGKNSIRVFANRHWRTAASTCLTFLTTRRTLRKSRHIFRTYALRNFDSSLWLSLTKKSLFRALDFCRWLIQKPFLAKVVAKSWIFGGPQIVFGKKYSLWVPLPGIATHLDARRLGPAVDWISLLLNESPPEHDPRTV